MHVFLEISQVGSVKWPVLYADEGKTAEHIPKSAEILAAEQAVDWRICTTAVNPNHE